MPLRAESEKEARALWGNKIPVSPSDEREAQEAFDLAETDSSERETLWRLLAAYRTTEDYDDFVSWLGLKTDEQTEALYTFTTACWVVGWNRYGWNELQKMCDVGWDALYRDGRKLL